MIAVKQLTKIYQQFKAVDQVSFTVQTGQTLALVGTSGSGKTTTLKMINRLIEPSSGQILLDDKDVMQYDPVEIRRDMGYVIQSIGLFPHYTIEENIAVVPELLNWKAARTKARVYALMDMLKIPAAEYAKKYPHQLSGGQQQRVGIARALAADPPIILMDEPFGALDPITRKDIRSDFMELDELSSKTTIMVTHDVEEAFELADLVCILDQGQVQQLADPKTLLFHPANDFVRAFLADKQLQLEFHALEIQDIWEQLPTEAPEKADTIAIKADATIFSAISKLTKAQLRAAVAKTEYQGQVRYYRLGQLMNSFQATLNHLKSETI
ncbi:MAG: ABC transporter ATP-binding protein [Saprospiraceae bacterium]|nr:ABC transporter ATP-binding protein [Saprospiraceae bacterium]